MARIRKSQMRDFVVAHLVPRLEDQDWLLHQDDALVKIRDEIVLGLHFSRAAASDFITQVYVRPLYWPGPAAAYGLTERIGRWCPKEEGLGEGWMYLNGPELAEEEAAVLARVINTRITPFFAQLTDGSAALRYQRTHFRDPLLSWNPIVVGDTLTIVEILGYLSAWTGDKRRARSLLGDVSQRIQRQQGEYWDGMRSHLQTTLSLLNKPAELHEFLLDTAARYRAELKLDRARPVLEVSGRRGKPRS